MLKVSPFHKCRNARIVTKEDDIRGTKYAYTVVLPVAKYPGVFENCFKFFERLCVKSLGETGTTECL